MLLGTLQQAPRLIVGVTWLQLKWLRLNLERGIRLRANGQASTQDVIRGLIEASPGLLCESNKGNSHIVAEADHCVHGDERSIAGLSG